MASPVTKLEPKKIYLKDCSFESPSSPHIFARGEVQPKMEVQMTIAHTRIEADHNFFEVVLKITVTATHEDTNLFLAEIQQAGIFGVQNLAEDRIEMVLEVACPHMLLPFAREELAGLVAKGGFPQLLLNPVNFEAIYQQKKEKEARSVEPPADARPN
ncbi:MAG: protein-export chaperone SecB [Pseudomonadota bacterium]